MSWENVRRFIDRNSKIAGLGRDIIVEFLEARAYLSAVTFPTNPPLYETGSLVQVGQVDNSYPAVADFNGDGFPDIATANSSISGTDGSISVLLNKGDGTFGPMLNLPAGERPFQVIAGVFTSSGHEDLVVTNSEDGAVGFYAGQGNGTFAAPILSTYGSPAPSGSGALAYLAAINLNTDGKLDLVIADQSDDELVTMLGNGAGSFTVEQDIPGEFDNIVTGKFLGDGRADVATVASSGSIIDIYRNNGDGTLATTPVLLDTGDVDEGSQAAGLVTGDFNGDEEPDLALLAASNSTSDAALTVFLNEGGGSFGPPMTTALQNATDLAVGDFDGDGKLDVVTTDGTNLVVYPGNGDGTFQTTAAFDLENYGFTSGPTVADFNNDAKPDVVGGIIPSDMQTYPTASAVAVFLNGQSSGGGGGSATSPLTPVISGKLPSLAIAGQKAAISQTVKLTNSGAAYHGSQTTQLFLSTDTTIDSNSIALPAKLTKIEKLKSGTHVSFKLSLKSIPSSVPAGTYHVLAQVTDHNGNNSATASTGTITIAPPQIDLSVTLAKFASSARGGKKFTETLRVANAGNIASVGTLPIVVAYSPDGLLSDATLLADPSKTINIKNGKSENIALSMTGLPGGDADFLIFQIDPNNTFDDINLANNVAVTPTKVMFS